MSLPLPIELGAPVHFRNWRPNQPDAILAITDSERRFIGSVLPTGCLTGDTEILINRAGCARRTTLAKEYHCQQRHASRRKAGVVPRTRSFNGETVQLHAFEGVVDSGMRPTWRIVLHTGKALSGTEDHLILTDTGWRALGTLRSGDNVVCDTPHAGQPLLLRDRHKPMYKQVQGLRYHPFANGVESQREGRLYRVPLHRLVVEAGMNGLPLDVFIEWCREDAAACETLDFLGPELIVHHKDENSQNNAFGNLEVVTGEEHKALHATVAHLGQGIPHLAQVELSASTGMDEQVYDLVACEPYQNFVANGIIAHNSGKTLTVVGAALAMGWRTCFLTSTKLLMEQYSNDMASTGLVEVKGQSNYECVAFQDEHRQLRDRAWHGCEDGPCRAGYPCSRKPLPDEGTLEKGCLSYDAIARAVRSPFVVTNYKYWLNANAHRPTLGRFDCLVLDEAHHAPTELADFLSTTWEPGDAQSIGSGGPNGSEEPGAWANWAKGYVGSVNNALETRPRSRAEFRKYRALKRAAKKLGIIGTMATGDWVIQRHAETWHFDPVWVSAYAEKLFRHIPRIVCTSATFTRKTAEMLGIESDNLTWHEAPSDFPASRRPVYFVPTVKVDYKADESQIRLWLATIDNFLRPRQDRKGIIHAVSYARAKQIRDYSEFRDNMILHDRHDTRDAVQRFKDAGPGTVLVSPSMTTGYDFPRRECEFAVIAKVPFPDRRNPVTAARTAADPQYPAYIAMQELVQAVGRGMRSADDRCETLIADSNCEWFMRRYRNLAPAWFLEAYQRTETLPEPPPCL